MPTKQPRKIFYLDAKKEKDVTAGGVIIYRIINNKVDLLLSEARGLYEDLGGRTDDDDKDIISTVSREAYEESNKLLDIKSIKKRLKNADPPIYMKRSKYAVYIIEATKEEEKLKSEKFGNRELHDDVPRKIKWIPLKKFMLPDILKYKINFRLKNKLLFDKLKSLTSEKQLSISMFSSSSGGTTDSDDTDESDSSDDSSESESSESSESKSDNKTKKPIKSKTKK